MIIIIIIITIIIIIIIKQDRPGKAFRTVYSGMSAFTSTNSEGTVCE